MYFSAYSNLTLTTQLKPITMIEFDLFEMAQLFFLTPFSFFLNLANGDYNYI